MAALWEDLGSKVIEGIIQHLAVGANYFYASDPMTPVSLYASYSKMQKDMELGSPNSGTYQDRPVAFIRLSDLPSDPSEGDELEIDGERLHIYKILRDGEGGATLHLGEGER